MDSQLWGTFSVADHLRRTPFVADVLLFDRLIVPVPISSMPGRVQQLLDQRTPKEAAKDMSDQIVEYHQWARTQKWRKRIRYGFIIGGPLIVAGGMLAPVLLPAAAAFAHPNHRRRSTGHCGAGRSRDLEWSCAKEAATGQRRPRARRSIVLAVAGIVAPLFARHTR